MNMHGMHVLLEMEVKAFLLLSISTVNKSNQNAKLRYMILITMSKSMIAPLLSVMESIACMFKLIAREGNCKKNYELKRSY